MKIKPRICTLIFMCATALLFARSASAAEGAFSDYFPGAYGSFAVAMTPPDGLLLADETLYLNAHASKAILQGTTNANLDVFAFYDLLIGLYTLEPKVLGGKFQFGGLLPIGHVQLDADVTTPISTHAISESDTNIGDMIFQPIGLYWTKGDWDLKFHEFVYAPTGHYEVANAVNVGRNYWAFDTNFALSWFHKKTGTEFAAMPGIMANTTNDETDYTTGIEFHLDFMANQFLSEHFGLGFQGYYYKQITGDSGSGALFGSFKGESVGVGPALVWIPKCTDGKLNIVGKWLYDLDATNRLKSNYGQVTVGYRL